MNNPFASEPITLDTALSRHECARRLDREFSRGSVLSQPGEKRPDVIGWYAFGRFWFRRARWLPGGIPFYAGVFATLTTGRLVAMTKGTRVNARIGLFPLTPAVVLIMGAGCLLGFAMAVVKIAEGPVPGQPPLGWVLVAATLAFLLAFPIALLFVRWIDPNDVVIMRKFLTTTLEAELLE